MTDRPIFAVGRSSTNQPNVTSVATLHCEVHVVLSVRVRVRLLGLTVQTRARWMFSAASVCLSVCQFVCQHDNFRTIERRMMKLDG